jgi:formate hydrogenlyase subunit 3/multisubunit Na+/H+ antiporter MnhD subunit
MFITLVSLLLFFMGQAKEKEKPEKRKKGFVRKFLEAGFLMLASAYLAFSVNEARQW